jgi:hypothetical protein
MVVQEISGHAEMIGVLVSHFVDARAVLAHRRRVERISISIDRQIVRKTSTDQPGCGGVLAFA